MDNISAMDLPVKLDLVAPQITHDLNTCHISKDFIYLLNIYKVHRDLDKVM